MQRLHIIHSDEFTVNCDVIFICIGHFLSQIEHSLQISESLVTINLLIFKSLLTQINILNKAPYGHKYLHQNRSIIKENENNITEYIII